MLSFLATHDFNGYVPGTQDLLEGYTTPDGVRHLSANEKMERGQKALAAFRDFRTAGKTGNEQARDEARLRLKEHQPYFGYGYISKAEELVPNVPLVYWSFRVMVGGGMALLLLLAVILWYGQRGRLQNARFLLHAGLWSIALVYLCGQAGWIVAEVGRQPWAIQDMLPVGAAISSLSAGAVQTTFFIFLGIFTLLLVAEVRILCRAIRSHKE